MSRDNTLQKLMAKERFTMLFAPIHRSFAYSMPDGRGKTILAPYKRNGNVFPNDLASIFDYFDEWKKCGKVQMSLMNNISGDINAMTFQGLCRQNLSMKMLSFIRKMT